MLKKLSVITPVAFALASILSLVVITQPTSAVSDNEQEHFPVTICHRDTNSNQPYGPKAIEVDDDAVDGVGGSDHYGQHTGPLADSIATAKALKAAHIKWGDIIPPLEGVHEGLNWTEAGQAIWEAGCVVPGQEDEIADISFGVVCSAEGALVTLVNQGDADGEVTLNGEVVVVPAESTVERVFETGDNGLQITITIDEDVVYDELVDCEEGDVLGETTVLPTTSGEAALLITGAIASFTLIAGLISLAVRNLLTRQ